MAWTSSASATSPAISAKATSNAAAESLIIATILPRDSSRQEARLILSRKGLYRSGSYQGMPSGIPQARRRDPCHSANARFMWGQPPSAVLAERPARQLSGDAGDVRG